MVHLLSHEDIITYKPIKIQEINDQKIRTTYRTPEFNPILLALRHKYLTIKELVIEYNRIVKERIETMDIDQKDKEKRYKQESRKDKTIYRYVKNLVDAGLVVAAGKRVKLGQIASETLYCRIAHIIYFKPDFKKVWETKEYKEILAQMEILLQAGFPDLKISKKIILEMIFKMEKIFEEFYHSSLNKLVDDKASYISGLTVRQGEIMTSFSQIIMILLHSNEFKEELDRLKK